jgi:hypothetical protein
MQNDKIILYLGHYDKEMANTRAWRFHAAICSKKNANPTSKNRY